METNYIVSIAPNSPTEQPKTFICRTQFSVMNLLSEYKGRTTQIVEVEVYELVKEAEE